MGADKANSQTAIIVAGITVVGTLGTSLFANWDKVFSPSEQASTSTPTVETPTSNATSDAPPSPETLPNHSPATANGFDRFWSSEEDITAEYLIDIELKSSGTKLSGTLQSFSQEGDDQSPLLSLVGEFEAEKGTVEIYDQKAALVGKAEITITNNSLTFKLLESKGIATETIPSQAVLYPIDKSEF
ncbi:hypothetical protein Lepto7376_0669 [[Leptolyngbya] sp. PCC 7376]|uniref:hypothetical protein n=1 Tax=[Leptolyngbya] sp. PCC 7376 TaxID=111781 RepID=UPI00029EDFA3|nr:hypothetical protein [[Leptolyngbya] sp. PCC 7376]AFY37073.1 hypothetical protein Lepto7376_0669 [[Leptolyngbya] sp. PCC 7376]